MSSSRMRCSSLVLVGEVPVGLCRRAVVAVGERQGR